MTEVITEKFRNKAKDAAKKGVLYGYCPNHLVVEHREELWVFPLNILFSKFRIENDSTQTMGSALYNPDLSSFTHENGKWSMTYWNQYGGESYVVITIMTADLSYIGDKFVNGKLVGSATGIIKDDVGDGWKLFFFHLTMLGLSNSEQCEFQKIN